jgi:glyoxylase-like metal-dependent hydrolase (beta-lactamase superfamily II)
VPGHLAVDVDPGAFRIGPMTVHPIYDCIAVLAPAYFTKPDGSATNWSDHGHDLDADGLIRVPVGCFLVRHGDRLILFDTGVSDLGVGNDMFEGSPQLMNGLAALGVAPADIDTVIVSHLHVDHIGWLSSNGAPTFPNASVRAGGADWQRFAIDAKPGPRSNRIRAVESQFEPISSEGAAIAPGIDVIATPGHTPGHISTVLSHGTERLIILGDALHCPAQLTEIEWEFVADVDKPLARQTRAALIREAEQPGTTLLPCHFPGIQAARLIPASAGNRSWQLTGPTA